MNFTQCVKKAEEHNDAAGLRLLLEELSYLVNALKSKQNSSKLDIVDFICLVDPTFDVGKDNARNQQSVENLRMILTAGCQPNRIPYYLPHTLEGESFRVDVVGTPLHNSLSNDHRPNKTISKACTERSKSSQLLGPKAFIN